MKKLMAVTTVGITAVVLSLALASCGSDTKADTKTSTSTSTITTSKAAPTTSAEAGGPNKTLQDYIKENQIVETPIHRGDPGSPTINVPVPPGWSDAGPSTPDWAYSEMVYDQPKVPDDPPRITAIVFKLTGNVDPAQVLAYAPNELRNLPGFEPLDNGHSNPLSGFDASQLAGYYMKDGNKRIIGRNTAVIPGRDDGLYVLQMTVDALADEQGPVIEALTNTIDPQTTITP